MIDSRLWISALPLLLGVTLVLTGCSQGDRRTVTVKDSKAPVVITEYLFSPSEIVTDAGPLELKVTNKGDLAHNLIILKGKKRYLVARTPTFQKGTRTIKTHVRPGTYIFVSDVGKDQELGLRGKIRVR